MTTTVTVPKPLCGLSFLAITLLFPYIALAQFNKPLLHKIKHKTDVIVMENGDRNTGEIKKMEFGVLYLKSDRAADTLKLDWERVSSLESIARYEFETIRKEVYFGTIAKQTTT